jgi:hypothetical protein
VTEQQPTAPPPLRPMIKEICANSGAAFTGLGRHLANDLCYHLVIHPATPAIYICQDDTRFKGLLNGIPEYLKCFTEPGYLSAMAGSCGVDQENPFRFNENSNRLYMHCYVDVFRRCSKLVPEDVYLKYLYQGLLDPRHTIGELLCSN